MKKLHAYSVGFKHCLAPWTTCASSPNSLYSKIPDYIGLQTASQSNSINIAGQGDDFVNMQSLASYDKKILLQKNENRAPVFS